MKDKKWSISSVKGLNGRPAQYSTLKEARVAARAVVQELKPAWGVDITDSQSGLIRQVVGRDQPAGAVEG